MRDECGPRRAVRAMRRCYPRYLQRVPDAAALAQELAAIAELEAVLDALDRAREERAQPAAEHDAPVHAP
jgi:tRNA-dihydrouridine synthase